MQQSNTCNQYYVALFSGLVVDILRVLRRWFIIILIFATMCSWPAGIAQSVQGLITRSNIRGLNSGGDQILRTHPEKPQGPPSLLYNGQRVFPGDKTAGHSVDLPPRPRPRLKNEHKYISTRNMGLHGLLGGEFAVRRGAVTVKTPLQPWGRNARNSTVWRRNYFFKF